MLRFSVLVGILLLVYEASSKPRSTWGKVADAVVQETLMSVDEGKMRLGLKEVEPPEDMDVTDVDVDPSMLMWKAVMASRRRALEEEAGEPHGRYHPAEAQPAPVLQTGDGPQAYPEMGSRYYQAEPDMDELYHHFPDPAGAAQQESDVEGDLLEQVPGLEQGPGPYGQAEVDLDGLYHADVGQVEVETLVEGERQVELPQGGMSVAGQSGRSFPPEDLDDLYHRY